MVLWNCGGLRSPTTSTALKMGFFDKEFKRTQFSVAAFVETHHRTEDDFPFSIKHHAPHYHLIHTPATKTHKAAGIIVLIHESFQIVQADGPIPGRLLNVIIRHKETKVEYNVSVFYGWHTTKIRKAQFTEFVSLLKRTHADSTRNILLGDFNFIDNDIDRQGARTSGEKAFAGPWQDLLQHLNLYDPFRLQYPKKKEFSFVTHFLAYAAIFSTIFF